MAVHVVFVLSAMRQGGNWQTGDEVNRVRSIVEAGVASSLSNLTLIEEFSGPTNLTQYFQFLVQHIDCANNLFFFDIIDEVRSDAKVSQALRVNLISDYRGKDDVVASVKRLAGSVEANMAQEATDETGRQKLETAIGKGLRTGELPEPDLMVLFDGQRKLGETGVWMGAYSEFAFLDKSWHSFTSDDLLDLLADFGLRERRFGAIQSQ